LGGKSEPRQWSKDLRKTDQQDNNWLRKVSQHRLTRQSFTQEQLEEMRQFYSTHQTSTLAPEELSPTATCQRPLARGCLAYALFGTKRGRERERERERERFQGFVHLFIEVY
jgi:hypothetical protein